MTYQKGRTVLISLEPSRLLTITIGRIFKEVVVCFGWTTT